MSSGRGGPGAALPRRPGRPVLVPLIVGALLGGCEGPEHDSAPGVAQAVQRLGFGDAPPDGMPIPATLPTWGVLRIGADGSLLALRTPRAPDPEPGDQDPSMGVRPPWAWDVFTPEGRHQGLLLLPRTFQLLDYGETGILMVETPAGEGPRVHLHPLPGWE